MGTLQGAVSSVGQSISMASRRSWVQIPHGPPDLAPPRFCWGSVSLKGGVPEWFNGAVSKAVVPYGTGGSNPPPAAC